jgi:hypothetical protein
MSLFPFPFPPSVGFLQTNYITELAVSVSVPFQPVGCVALGVSFLCFGGKFLTLGVKFLSTVVNDSCIPFVSVHVLDTCYTFVKYVQDIYVLWISCRPDPVLCQSSLFSQIQTAVSPSRKTGYFWNLKNGEKRKKQWFSNRAGPATFKIWKKKKKRRDFLLNIHHLWSTALIFEPNETYTGFIFWSLNNKIHTIHAMHHTVYLIRI